MNDKKPEKILTDISLSFLTTPFLLGLVMVESVLDGLEELGQTTEELFRAERLPILNFPNSETQTEDKS